MVPQSAGSDVGGVLDRAITLFKAALASVVVLSFASGLVRSLPYLNPGWTDVLLSSGVWDNAVVEPANLLRALGDLAIWFAVAWPIGMFLGLGVIIQMEAVSNGRTLRWPAALFRAWRRLPAMAGCLFAYAGTTVAIVGTALFLGAMVVGTFLADLPISVLSLVAGLIGAAFTLVAAIPLLVLFVYWCLALPLVAIEDLDAVAALRRSWRLVRGNWWRTLVIISVAGFIVFAVASLAGLVGMLLVAATNGGSAARVAVVLLNAAGAAVTTPLMVAVLLGVLKDLSRDPA